MTKGRKTGGRDFKPGVVTNPKGRPKLPEEVKLARNMSQNEVILIFNEIMRLTDSEIASQLRDPAVARSKKALMEILQRSGRDHSSFEFFLNRMIGKVTDKVEVKMPTPLVIRRPSTGEEVVLTSKIEGDE